MLSDFIDRLFNRSSPKSRDEVKLRLQKLLAHDRTTLSPQELAEIREEILAVVSRYVELDQEGFELALESDQRLTSLVANLPIRRIKSEDKDGAAKRVAEIPKEAIEDIEAMPENMALDEDEIFTLEPDPSPEPTPKVAPDPAPDPAPELASEPASVDSSE